MPTPGNLGTVVPSARRVEMFVRESGDLGWRLVSANGRIVGESSRGFPARSDCEEDLRALATRVGILVPDVVRSGREWIWVVAGGDGLPLARSHGSYSRRSQAQKSGHHFLLALVPGQRTNDTPQEPPN